MATKIRLQRGGRKGYAFYSIVIADVRAPRDGKFTEKIGTYNPNTNPATVDLNFDRALYWVETGAQPTDTVRNILQREGVYLMKHLRGGVKKGAFDESEVQKRFDAWKAAKEQKLNDGRPLRNRSSTLPARMWLRPRRLSLTRSLSRRSKSMRLLPRRWQRRKPPQPWPPQRLPPLIALRLRLPRRRQLPQRHSVLLPKHKGKGSRPLSVLAPSSCRYRCVVGSVSVRDLKTSYFACENNLFCRAK